MLESIPHAREERWNLLASLIALWRRPLADGDGYSADALDAAASRLGIAFPKALREWYHLAGRRDDLWSRQDMLLAPDQIALGDGFLKFYCENQVVLWWGIRESDLEADDPPVLVSSVDSAVEWSVENETLSEFALQRFIYDLKWGTENRCRGTGVSTPAMMEAIAASYPHFAFPDWHLFGTTTRFFGTDEIVIQHDGEGGNDYFWVSSRAERAFNVFSDLVERTGGSWVAMYDN